MSRGSIITMYERRGILAGRSLNESSLGVYRGKSEDRLQLEFESQKGIPPHYLIELALNPGG